MIRKRIRNKEATVMTSGETKSRLSKGESIGVMDVDVVTCGTCGVMSGTDAVLSFPVAYPGSFMRAGDITINGVPCLPGPCPNERLRHQERGLRESSEPRHSYGPILKSGTMMWELLPSCYDIDTPEDLVRLMTDLQAGTGGNLAICPQTYKALAVLARSRVGRDKF